MKPQVSIVGVGCCLGATGERATGGPKALQAYGFAERLQAAGVTATWVTTLRAQRSQYKAPAAWRTADCYRRLGQLIRRIVRNEQQFLVLGADQGCAIGTWGSLANTPDVPVPGILWITGRTVDPEASDPNAIDPLACLLGEDRRDLLRHAAGRRCVQRECVYVLSTGARPGRIPSRVHRLGVRVVEREALRERGFHGAMGEVAKTLSPGGEPIGISIDLRALDPGEQSRGLTAPALAAALGQLTLQRQVLGVEIVGYEPANDSQWQRADLVLQLAAAALSGQRAPHHRTQSAAC
jgi:arginase family enzyme